MSRWLLFFALPVGLTAQRQVVVDSADVGLDTERAFYLLRIELADLDYPVAGFRAGTQVLSLVEPAETLRYDQTYQVADDSGKPASVGFTRLPLVQIRVSGEVDEHERSPAELSYSDGLQTTRGHLGIRHRGRFSLSFPKKTFDLEFRIGPNSEVTHDLRFGDLREDDDWILDALYNEPLRVNAFVAHQLWLDLHTPYYAERDERARSGADVRFVEVFYHDRYWGLYLLSEQVDRKQLRLKKPKDGAVRGELYKAVTWSAGTRMTGQPALPAPGASAYAGFELKHPDTTSGIGWNPLYDLLGFATISSDEAFIRGAESHFQLDNLIDYFIFVNIANLRDNLSKNVYLGRYSAGEPYFYVPWDLDGSFGNRYDGTPHKSPEGWLTNGLQDRLLELNPANYRNRFCERYRELRATLLGTPALNGRIRAAVAYLSENGVYDREVLAWPGSVDRSEEYLSFVEDWNERRLLVTDRHICGEPLVGTPAVDANRGFRVFPNPARSYLRVLGFSGNGAPYLLYDALGAAVRSGYLAEGDDTVSLTGLGPGMYTLRIGNQVRRVLIQP